jgi:cardiolipin synthase C
MTGMPTVRYLLAHLGKPAHLVSGSKPSMIHSEVHTLWRFLTLIKNPLRPACQADYRSAQYLHGAVGTSTMQRRLAALVLSAVIGGCAVQPIALEDVPRTPSYAAIEPASTSLGREIADVAIAHEPKSGFYVLDRGEEALLWRGALADRAERSIDAQYFIWSDDNVGTIAAERLLRAADRGVRVRVLVDDLPISTDPRFLAMLNAHERIEIRIYNPSGVIGRGFLSKMLTFASDFLRLNRRMHNKALIIDGAVAVIGGRNIADEYYDMNRDYNFRDRDVLAVGPVIGSIERSFDRFWNSVWAVPVEAFVRADLSEVEREVYYERLHAYVRDSEHFPERFNDALAQTYAQFGNIANLLVWGEARVIYDIPGKNDDPGRMDAYGDMGRELTDAVSAAREEVLAETPYLVMMPGTFTVVGQLRDRGVRVRILTNSLVSTDEIFAFSRYAMQRGELLRLGVELHEFMPYPKYHGEIVARLHRMQQPPHLALHAKTMVIDRRTVFIGSFNMDPRSTHLNTEMGILVDSPELAAQIAAAIEQDMDPSNSWAVIQTGDDGTIVWRWASEGRTLTTSKEPDASGAALLKLFLFSLLPIGGLI